MKRRKVDRVVQINLLSFPEVLLVIILSFLPFKKRISTSRTCKTFNRLLNYNWKTEFGSECMIAFNPIVDYATDNVNTMYQSSFFIYLIIHGLDVIEFVQRMYGGSGMLEDAILEIARRGFFPFDDRFQTQRILLYLARNTQKFEAFFNIQQSKMMNNLRVYPFMFLYLLIENRVSAISTIFDDGNTRICKDGGFKSYKEEDFEKLDGELMDNLISHVKLCSTLQDKPYELYVHLVRKMCNHSSFLKIEEVE